jgi:SAM-dependent methyltransferase
VRARFEEGHCLKELKAAFEQDVPNVIEEVSPDEGATARSSHELYLASGQWAFRHIKLAMLASGKTDLQRILDLPCGYGRVLRILKAAFPSAELTACDIHKPAVDFCARTFDAKPVYSVTNPEGIPLEGPFDLIWVGSLLTHVDAPQWQGFLKLFEQLLPPGGLLVFTTHGEFAIEAQLHSKGSLGLTPDQKEAILRAYRSQGFGYCDYTLPPQGVRRNSLPLNYGISLASPSWVCAQLDGLKFDLLTYRAGVWGDRWGFLQPKIPGASHDVIGCIRTR